MTAVLRNIDKPLITETVQVSAENGMVKKLVGFCEVDLQLGKGTVVEVQFKKQEVAYWKGSLDK